MRKIDQLFAEYAESHQNGHKIEGKKPSFLKDLQFLLIGPIWLLHFVLKKLSLKY